MSETVGGAASTTDMGSVVGGAAAQPAAQVGFLGEVEAWFLNLLHVGQSLWGEAKIAETDAKTFVADHPQVIAEAEALTTLAPPAVQVAINEGLNVAEKLAAVVASTEDHAAAIGLPMAPVKP